MDYGRFFEKKRERPKQELDGQEDEMETVGGLTNFWSNPDKKTKTELLIFFVVLLVIIGMLTFYLFQRPQKGSDVPIGDQFVPGLEE